MPNRKAFEDRMINGFSLLIEVWIETTAILVAGDEARYQAIHTHLTGMKDAMIESGDARAELLGRWIARLDEDHALWNLTRFDA